MDKSEVFIGDLEVASDMIRNMVYVIRGQQVMLDSDLAMLYQVETKVLNQAVNRNITRFPENFRFQLNDEEYNSLRSQFVTSKNLHVERKGGRRYKPFVFTEQGIAMLSGILKSQVAINVSIKIMNSFVEMRRFISSNALLFEHITNLELKQLEYQKQSDEKFEQIFKYISEHEEHNQKVFFDGQIYDAFSLIVRLIQKAEKEILLIDGYVDINTLNLLCKKKEDVSVTIYTRQQTRLSDLDVDQFNAQYPTLDVKYTSVFHDRFLIIDENMVYHIGASLKDAGKKVFGLTRINDEVISNDILRRLAGAV